jgi:hypothetical protein
MDAKDTAEWIVPGAYGLPDGPVTPIPGAQGCAWYGFIFTYHHIVKYRLLLWYIPLMKHKAHKSVLAHSQDWTVGETRHKHSSQGRRKVRRLVSKRRRAEKTDVE